MQKVYGLLGKPKCGLSNVKGVRRVTFSHDSFPHIMERFFPYCFFYFCYTGSLVFNCSLQTFTPHKCSSMLKCDLKSCHKILFVTKFTFNNRNLQYSVPIEMDHCILRLFNWHRERQTLKNAS